MEEGFHNRHEIQYSTKKEQRDFGNQLCQAWFHQLAQYNDPLNAINSSSARAAPECIFIVSFIESLGDGRGEFMPNLRWHHQPLFSKNSISDIFVADQKKLNTKQIPCIQYLMKHWNICCKDIEVIQWKRLQIWATCDQLGIWLQEALKERQYLASVQLSHQLRDKINSILRNSGITRLK